MNALTYLNSYPILQSDKARKGESVEQEYNQNSRERTGNVADRFTVRIRGTGSVIKKDNIYYAFYTAHNGNIEPKEVIRMATSTDINANGWEKSREFMQQLNIWNIFLKICCWEQSMN